jgi:isocitrate/isopropylmalate dehydrogenase
VFAPTHGAAEEIAGQGVANPAPMLLAAALMLGEGLGERRAAETLTGALLDASGNGAVTPDVAETGVGATTRQFADVVLARLPFAWTNAEFYREAVA